MTLRSSRSSVEINGGNVKVDIFKNEFHKAHFADAQFGVYTNFYEFPPWLPDANARDMFGAKVFRSSLKLSFAQVLSHREQHQLKLPYRQTSRRRQLHRPEKLIPKGPPHRHRLLHLLIANYLAYHSNAPHLNHLRRRPPNALRRIKTRRRKIRRQNRHTPSWSSHQPDRARRWMLE